MNSRGLSDNWVRVRAMVRHHWPLLTEQDVAGIAGERDELMRLLKSHYPRTYEQIERELTEFELREVRSGFANPSSPDGLETPLPPTPPS
jgi:hypothetical protein